MTPGGSENKLNLSALDRARLLREQKEVEREEVKRAEKEKEELEKTALLDAIRDLSTNIDKLTTEKAGLEQSLQGVRGQRLENINTQKAAIRELKSDESTEDLLNDEDVKKKVFSGDEERLQDIKQEEGGIRSRLKEIEGELANLESQKRELYAQTPEGQEEEKKSRDRKIIEDLKQNYGVRQDDFVHGSSLEMKDIILQTGYRQELTKLIDEYGEDKAKEVLVSVHGESLKDYFEKQRSGPNEALRMLKENPAYSAESISEAKIKYKELTQVENEINDVLKQEGKNISIDDIGPAFVMSRGSEVRVRLSKLFETDDPRYDVDYIKIKQEIERLIVLAVHLKEDISRAKDVKRVVEGLYSKDGGLAAGMKYDAIVGIDKYPKFTLADGESIELRPGDSRVEGLLHEELSRINSNEKDAMRMVELQVENNLDKAMAVEEANENGLSFKYGDDVRNYIEEFNRRKDKAERVLLLTSTQRIRYNENLDRKLSIYEGAIVYEDALENVTEKEEEKQEKTKQIEVKLRQVEAEYNSERNKSPLFGKEKHREKVVALEQEVEELKRKLRAVQNENTPRLQDENMSPKVKDLLDDLYYDGSFSSPKGTEAFMQEHGNRIEQGMTLREMFDLIQEKTEKRLEERLPGRLSGYEERRKLRWGEVAALEAKYEGQKV